MSGDSISNIIVFVQEMIEGDGGWKGVGVETKKETKTIHCTAASSKRYLFEG